jgi:hypothetical protein
LEESSQIVLDCLGHVVRLDYITFFEIGDGMGDFQYVVKGVS